MYGYFAAWRDDGTTERIHDLLRRRLRRARGRSEEPTAVAVDSQTVKASGSAAPDTVGFDGNKKTKGRKRHIAVDTLGLLIVLGVSAASLADSPVGRQVLTHVAAVAPTVSKAWVDGGYNQKVVDHGQNWGSTSRSSPVSRAPASRSCRAGGWWRGHSAGSYCTDAWYATTRRDRKAHAR